MKASQLLLAAFCTLYLLLFPALFWMHSAKSSNEQSKDADSFSQIRALEALQSKDAPACYSQCCMLVESRSASTLVREWCLHFLVYHDATPGSSMDDLVSKPWFRSEWLSARGTMEAPSDVFQPESTVLTRLVIDFGEPRNLDVYLLLSPTTAEFWEKWVYAQHCGLPFDSQLTVKDAYCTAVRR